MCPCPPALHGALSKSSQFGISLPVCCVVHCTICALPPDQSVHTASFELHVRFVYVCSSLSLIILGFYESKVNLMIIGLHILLNHNEQVTATAAWQVM